MRPVLFLAKTDLNQDGRILNEMGLLTDMFKELSIDFILLADRPVTVELGERVTLHEIKPAVRHNKYLRFLTVLEFTWRSLRLMLKLKPAVVHLQDTAVVLPGLIYSFIKPEVYMIYDDHEIPNENAKFQSRLMHRLEVWLMKRVDYVIHANRERMELIHQRHNIKTPANYFLNLPYFEEAGAEPDEEGKKVLNDIDNLRSKGTKFIMHQGVITKERGSAELSEFSNRLPHDFRILLVGGNRKGFEEFVETYGVDSSRFYFVGSVNYAILSKFWERAIASIIMYLPTYMNNKLCAPNRFFIALGHGLPVLVNRSNPVLNNFINHYKSGFDIESFGSPNDFKRITDFKIQDNIDLLNQLLEEERFKLLKVYQIGHRS